MKEESNRLTPRAPLKPRALNKAGERALDKPCEASDRRPATPSMPFEGPDAYFPIYPNVWSVWWHLIEGVPRARWYFLEIGS